MEHLTDDGFLRGCLIIALSIIWTGFMLFIAIIGLKDLKK